MSESLLKLMLLKSVILNLPIIKSLGIRIMRIPAVVGPEGKTADVVRLLMSKGTEIITPSHSKSVRQRLMSKAYIALIYMCSKRVKNTEPIEEIKAAFLTQTSGDNAFKPLPIIVTDSAVALEMGQDMFRIDIDDELLSEVDSIETYQVVPKPEMLACVIDRAKELQAFEDNPDLLTLMTAVAFLYPMVDSETFSSLISVARRMVDEDENARFTDGADKFFCEALSAKLRSMGRINTVRLPNIERRYITEMDRTVFYDDVSMYVNMTFFRDVTAEMVVSFPSDELKKTLVEKGILIADEKGTYTCRMQYCTEMGETIRARMLKISRDAVRRLSNIDFIEYCEIYSDDNTEQEETNYDC